MYITMTVNSLRLCKQLFILAVISNNNSDMIAALPSINNDNMYIDNKIGLQT